MKPLETGKIQLQLGEEIGTTGQYINRVMKKAIGYIRVSTEEHFPEGDDFANIYRSLLMFVTEQERTLLSVLAEVEI